MDKLNPEIYDRYRASLETTDARIRDDHATLVRMTQELHETLRDRSDMLSKEMKFQNDILQRRIDASDLSATQTLSDTIQRAVKVYKASGEDAKNTGPACASDIEDAILRSLLYPSMKVRHESIAEAYAKTFRWALEPPTNDCPWDDLMEWLRVGDNIYWVSGKAASGKSTLLKFLLQQTEIWRQLDRWASDRDLVCADFFFWGIGSPIQKSQSGMLRSLLHKALTQQRHLIPMILPDLWKQLAAQSSSMLWSLSNSWHPWSLAELRILFDSMIKRSSSTIKFCFFIDGLDEFDGDHLDIAYIIRDIAANSNVKICVSSRPLMIFEHEFERCRRLRLQDLTAADIRIYVHDQLNSHRRFVELAHEDPEEAPRLVRELVQMSSGVFLWVTLAVRSLLKGLSNYDTISDLQRRLRGLPPELDALYSLMLNSIDPPFYMEQASRLFQIVYHAISPISVLGLSFADQDDPVLALSARIGALTRTERDRRVRDMKNRLQSRCGGLLETQTMRTISSDLSEKSDTVQVQYLHLTVKEFLEKPDVWSTLLYRTSGTGFDASTALLHSTILELKATSPAIWDNQIMLQISTAMSYGLLAENSTGQAQTDLIDEIDRVARLLYPDSQQHHWSHFLHRNGSGMGDSILTYAVSKGLTLYVQLRHGPSLCKLNSKCSRALLSYATGCTAGSVADRLHEVRPSMVAMLLDAGLSPNEHSSGSSSWMDLLAVLLFKAREKVHVPAVWMEICRLFLLYGADPDATLGIRRYPGQAADGPAENFSLPRILHIVFSSHMNSEAFKNLVQLQAERSRDMSLKRRKRAAPCTASEYLALGVADPC